MTGAGAVEEPGGDVYRVFLSSTAEDLTEHRAAVLDALAGMDNVKPVNMESFGARGRDTVTECLGLVASSDVVVVVVAHRYGWVPTVDDGGDGESSITAHEVAAASAEPPKPVLAFLVDEQHPWTEKTEQDALTEATTDAEYLEIGRRVRLLQRFKSELGGRIRETFTDEGDLAAKVTTAVSNEVLRLGTERTKARIASGIDRERQPAEPQPVRGSKFVNPAPMSAPSWFQGRHVETRLIGEFLGDDSWRVMTVVGRGGVGKTAMVCRLLKSLEAGRLPDDLGDFVVDGIVYLSPVGRHHVTYDDLVTDLMTLLDGGAADRVRVLYEHPGHDPRQVMLALLEQFRGEPVVVLLDNFESVIDSETESITDEALRDALLTVLGAPEHAVRVVITSRIPPTELTQGQDAARHKALGLDKGLGSPDAENVLRALDESNSVGLAAADDAVLKAAQERTRGYPRALEAVYSILETDRTLTLRHLLDDTADGAEDRIVEVLVGHAFDVLDPEAQTVMQAVAVYPSPVSAVAVDFLLQPDDPTTNAGPILKRLVRRHLVQTDAGSYSLHPVDRDYALTQLPDSDGNGHGDRRAELDARAADYYQQVRTPRESWRSIDDVGPQLAEFQLRVRTEDYDTAAKVLSDIDFDYLRLWGHYRLLIDLRHQLDGYLTNPATNAHHLSHLGMCYFSLGDYPKAIQYYEEALGIARDIGDRRGESSRLGGLGICYWALGDYPKAIQYYEEALGIARDIGDRRSEGIDLGNLGICYEKLGDYPKAIQYYEEALGIARDIGDRRSEGIDLGNLGICYEKLGDYPKAIQYHEEALEIARDIGYRYVEACALVYLARVKQALHQPKAVQSSAQAAAEIADQTGDIEPRAEARIELARILLTQNEAEAALDAASQAQTIDYPPVRADSHLLAGIAHLHLDQPAEATPALRHAIEHADHQLGLAETPAAFDTKALALCGLTLTGDNRTNEAASAFQDARSITTAKGVVERTVATFDLLASIDSDNVLSGLRAVAQRTTTRR